MNQCFFMGNLVKDVEVKTFGKNRVANFTIAVSRQFKRSNGESAKEVSYLDMEAWDTGGDTIAKFFKKGDKIIVICSVKQETWDDKTSGQKRSKLKFRVNQFHFAESKRNEEPQEASPSGAVEGGPAGEGANDDIPF